MDAESDEFPWPKPGDILFRSDEDPQSDAWLNWALRGWDAYASGYLEAANLLVEKALETGQRTDTLIYPVAFLYRHYLELRLKEITIQGGELISGQREFRRVHAMDILWNSVRLILEKVWPNGPTIDLDAVEKVILQFHNLDLTSEAFRYPVDGKENATLSGLNHVGPRNLRDVMGPQAYSKPRAPQFLCIWTRCAAGVLIRMRYLIRLFAEGQSLWRV